MAGSLNLKKVEELRMKLADLISVIVYDYGPVKIYAQNCLQAPAE